MPQYVINQTMLALNEKEKPIKGSKILIIGLAYKPDIDDMRESPAFELMNLLDQYGAEIEYFDPYISEITPTRENAKWTGKKSIEWSTDLLNEFDAVIISTDHSAVDYGILKEKASLIIDTRNVYPKSLVDKASNIYKA